MSNYTTEVRFICENAGNNNENADRLRIDDILHNSWQSIFDYFPIYDENYREILCCKILKHYYTREIGYESVGLWKLKLNTKMQEIMPFYNQLYKSTILEFNPLYNVDLKTSHETKGTEKNINGTVGHSESEISNEAISKLNKSVNAEMIDAYSETPQGTLDGVDENAYLTSARKVNNNEQHSEDGDVTSNGVNTNNYTENNTGNRKTTEEYLEHVVGSNGLHTASDLIAKYRNIIINVDMQIINELKYLFITLW